MSHNDERLDALSHDHHDLSASGRIMSVLVGEGDIAEARARFGSLAFALREHMWAEEHLLFTALERHDEYAGSVRRLRAEHERMREMVTRAEQDLDDQAWGQLVAALLHAFAVHEVEEEEDLFPAVGVVLPYPVSHE